MTAKFVWNGQVIEQELRAMSEPPNKVNATTGNIICSPVYVLLLTGDRYHYTKAMHNTVEWVYYPTLKSIDTNTLSMKCPGWCEMPELMEVVE